MKLVNLSHKGLVRLGVWREGLVYDVAECARQTGTVLPADMMAFLAAGPAAFETLAQVMEAASRECAYQEAQVRFLAPLPRPGKIVCVAGNYAEHVREGGRQAYGRNETTPWLFLKPHTTVIGPEEPIRLPKRLGIKVDWECELGVVIGTTCKDIPASRALDCIAGYTVFNDISARAIDPPLQRKLRDRDPFHDWLHGKWFDTFGPMGPCVALKDEVPDPQNLHLELRYNSEVRQSASTSQMIYSVAELIEFISAIMTLEPGDVISTGTPSGIGRTTGTFLKDGDVLEAEIERIGLLRNPVCG
jgi:2,4-diketo-3-deoxy-L-fuconate hydrolase